MKKITIAFLALAFSMMLTMIPPTMACKPARAPEVVPFGLTAATIHDIAGGTFWWTGGGTILHVRGLTKEMAFTAGSPPNTIIYGLATTTTDYVFNTRTGRGIYTRTWEITLVTPYYMYKPGNPGVPPPYGIGTLEGIEVGKATSIFYQLIGDGSFNEAVLSLADFTGKLVAVHGTCELEKAILLADTLGYPFGPPGQPPVIVRINLGNTIYEPTGKLILHG